MTKKRIRFIINPISGGRQKRNLSKLIDKHLNADTFTAELAYTTHPGHARELAKKGVSDGVDVIVSVGGDGSVHEVGTALINSNSTLGIIPQGSGNGIARHLKIPLQPEQAIKLLNDCNTKVIDTGKVNGSPFIGVAGIGFDAWVGEKFDKSPTRGFWTYFYLTLKEYFQYQPKVYQIESDEETVTGKALLVCVANSSQYGNNAVIAPQASMENGKLHLVVVQKAPFWAAFGTLFKLFNGKMDRSKYATTIASKSYKIKCQQAHTHMDGEPCVFHGDLSIEVVPRSLNVLTTA